MATNTKNKSTGSTSASEGQLRDAKADAAIDAAIAPVVRKPSPEGGKSVSTPNSSGMVDVVPGDGLPVNKKEMILRVANRLGLRPNQVRDVTEAALAELGAALSAGEELKLPSLGKMQAKRKKDIGDAEIMICKLRRKKVEETGVDPLAPAAE